MIFSENSFIVAFSINDPVNKGNSTYKDHLIILLIKQKLENMDHFSFKEASKI